MDVKVKSEPLDTEKDIKNIKEESELIIESDWLPTKLENEEIEYYQEFVDECRQNMSCETVAKNESGHQQFTIKYLDESDEYEEGNEDNDYVDSDDTNTENDSDEDDNYLGKLETKKVLSKESSSGSKDVEQFGINQWITDNYINIECPVCYEKLANYNEWRRHITLNHKDSIEESESNYYFSSDKCGVCKKCSQEFVAKFSRYLHSAKCNCTAKLGNYICKICNFNSKRLTVEKHILVKHTEVVEEFKTSGPLKSIKCPLCSSTYIKHIHLCYHFVDYHPQEYKAKLIYNCHLCKHLLFIEEEDFLQHLIEKHELNSWKMLNYRKVFQDKEYFACVKCNRLFFQNDTCKLLCHFLKHEKKFRWSCKFCCKSFYFKTSAVSHMCVNMVLYYEKHFNTIRKVSRKPQGKIKNLQEFEEHIAHVCPFCNEEFGKMINWQHHLRTDHDIETLQGLQMKVIANDSNKLSCVICHTVVSNTPEQLHAHRFQHLPYKPYKCLLCSIALNTFRMAVNHVVKNCNDEDLLVEKIDDPTHDIRFILEMQCSFCNYQKIPDVKNVFRHHEDEHNYFEEFFVKHSDNSMTCKICQKQFIQQEKKSSFSHLHNHFDEKSFKCKLCLRSYSTLGYFSEHFLHYHNANKPLNIESSENNTHNTSYFFNKQDEITNVANVRQLGESSFKSYVLNEFAEFISYACPECNEGMTTQQNWYTHITTQHSFFDESNLYIKKADGSLKCPTCNKSANTRRDSQQKHKLTHMPYKSFICNLCYVRCNSLGVLYKHFRRKHFAQGIFKCPICPDVLQTEHQRTVHLKEIHPRNEWPDNMCLICYKILSKKDNLNSHMLTHDAEEHFRRKHFAQGTFECPLCSEVLQTEHQRTEHLENEHPRIEWPKSMCLICYKILSNKRNLNKHMVTHNENRIKHTCDICGSKLCSLRDFNAHMERHKTRGEIKKKVDDDITTQPESNNSQSKDTNVIEIVPKYGAGHTNKRKSLAKPSSTKKIKNYEE